MKINALERATEEDLLGVLKIEEEYFGDYDRSLKYEDISRWYTHNPDMFYVVKSDEGEVLAASIFVPITKETYDRIIRGEISDIYSFKEEDVFTNFDTDYFHLESVAATKTKGQLTFYKISVTALRGIIKEIALNAKHVTSSPITDEGKKTLESFGFTPRSIEDHNGEKFVIYGLDVTDNKKDKAAERYKIEELKKER